VVAVTVQNPTNPLYTFSAVPLAGTIAGEVVIQTTGIPLLVPIQPPAGVPLPPNVPVAAPVVPVLLAIAAPPPGSPLPDTDLVAVVLPALNAFSDPGEVVNAVAQLAPSAPILSAPLVTFQGSRQFRGILQSRIDEILCGPIRQDEPEVAGCRDDQYSGWWLKGFGYAGRQGARDGMSGYDTSIVGAMIGFDVAAGPHTRVGFGLGYARSEIDGQTFGSGSAETSFNSYRGTIYAAHEIGPWFMLADASIGLNDYTGTRNISFTGVQRRAEADYDGQDYTGSLTGGYRLATNGFIVTPRASLQYTHVDVGGYEESGAGDIGLRVESQSYDFLESVLGVKVERPFVHRGTRIVPEVHFNWLRELNNPTLTNTASFVAPGSPSFTTPGLSTADNTFNVGTGVTLLSCACAARTWSLEAVYDYQWRDDRYTAHQGMLRFTGRF
jgi:outer membrane autotransporter protein